MAALWSPHAFVLTARRSLGSSGDVIGNRIRLTSLQSVQFNLVSTSALGFQEIFDYFLKKGVFKDAFESIFLFKLITQEIFLEIIYNLLKRDKKRIQLLFLVPICTYHNLNYITRKQKSSLGGCCKV